MIFSAFPSRLLQLSTAGEVFLEGTCPLSRCPQTAKLPAPCFRRTEKVGEKSDSFSRAERTRPLRPVSRLQLLDFENIPVECFQRILPLLNSRTRHNLFRLYASPERGDSPRGGEMPKGQRGPLSTRGTADRRWRGLFVKSFIIFSMHPVGTRRAVSADFTNSLCEKRSDQSRPDRFPKIPTAYSPPPEAGR